MTGTGNARETDAKGPAAYADQVLPAVLRVLGLFDGGGNFGKNTVVLKAHYGNYRGRA